MKWWQILVLCFLTFLCFYAVREVKTGENLQLPELTLNAGDRILILAPHPDDEVLGCAGVIQEALAKDLPLRVAFLTYGDSNQWSFMVYRKRLVLAPKVVQGMGLIRHDEAYAASKALGLTPEHLVFLGYPDLGTLNIWYSHWGDRLPFKTLLTKAMAVPYINALRPGAPYKGEEIMKDLTSIIKEFRPTKIFVSHPADYHPDHRALYLFTQIALWDLEEEMKPEVYPYLVHFRGWPRPQGYFPDKYLEPPLFFSDKIFWKIKSLTADEINKKEEALKAHKTQYNSNARELSSFVRLNEFFGDFPKVELSSDSSAASLSPQDMSDMAEIPEEPAASQRAALAGIEERGVKLQKDYMIFSISFSRPLAREIGIAVHIFGYRKDKPFAQMPKLRIKLGTMMTEVYDQNRRLPNDSIHTVRHSKRTVLYVPLKILGYPIRVLTSANSYISSVPVDWVSWQVIELPKE